MSEITVIVPVLNRPAQAQILVDSLFRHSTVAVALLFVVTPGDDAEIAACEKLRRAFTDGSVDVLVTPWTGGRGDYARKINLGFAATTSPYVFTGADDIRFTKGWDTAMLAAAGENMGVVGSDDHCNPRTQQARRHSTHSLVSRAYADEHGVIDGDGTVLSEGYWHNFVDDELVQTAIARRMYRASHAVVTHTHPLHDRSVKIDPTYVLGQERFDEDRQRFLGRTRLWRNVNRRRSSRAARP